MKTVYQHLLKRHVDSTVHRVVVDEDRRVATFYLYNLSGQIVGYQEYRPDSEKLQNNDPRGRYHTYRRSDTVALFGVESLSQSSSPVFLVEGIFDAVRLTRRGASALAVLSNNPGRDVGNFLYALSRTVVAVCDNDPAGRALAAFGHQSVVCTQHDLGDSDEDFVTELLAKFG
jgi:DNA primase